MHYNKITDQVRLKMSKESIEEGEKFTPAKHIILPSLPVSADRDICSTGKVKDI